MSIGFVQTRDADYNRPEIMATIRVASSADLKRLIDLDPLSRTDSKRVPFIEHAVGSGTCHLVEDEGRLVGYGVLSHAFYQYGFIEMLYIHPSFRRRRLGTSLTLHLEGLCMTEKLFTSTNQSNKPAQALFQSLGYSPSGTIENLDEGDPELVYVKRLNR